jgi:hypothetical protein
MGNDKTSDGLSPLDKSRLRAHVVELARSAIGLKEEGANNSGPFIEAMGGKSGAEWCGLFVGWVYRMACDDLGLPAPAWAYRPMGGYQTGAKALTKALGRAGRIKKPSAIGSGWSVQPGDIVCWSRGVLGWQGHVGIVTEGMRYIAGNEGRNGTVLERRIADSKLTLWRYASVG